MEHEPDYARYSFDELIDAASHIDREKYRDRALRIEEEIARRPQDNNNVPEAAFLVGDTFLPSDETPLHVLEQPDDQSPTVETVSDAAHEPASPSFWKVLVRGIAWATVPFAFPIFLLYSVLKPVVKGKAPNGLAYVLWVLGIIFFNSLGMLPVGSAAGLPAAFRSPGIRTFVLTVDIVVSILTVLAILVTFRKSGIPNSFIPIKQFKIEKRFYLLWALSFLPLASLLLPKPDLPDPREIVHPVILALVTSLKAASYGSVMLTFISLVVLAPIVEELVFRGLLVEESHEKRRRKVTRYSLDFLVCLLFAALHVPVAFVVPFLLAAAFIYIRRRTASLVPSMVMHASWNLSVLLSIFRNYG